MTNLRNISFKSLIQKEQVLELLTRVVIIIFATYLLISATIGNVKYWEIDSYALPAISIQYRGSLIINQSDIEVAKKDFPTWYQEVTDYDTLHSAKLIKLTEEDWLSYYFPTYSLISLPVKLVLQMLSLPQERAFIITNAILFIAALEIVRRKLKQPIQNKLLLILLLIISPAFIMVNYASAEVFILSLVIISLVHFSNKEYKRAALFVSIASMPNPTIMVYGMAIILDYFMNVLSENKKVKLLQLIKTKCKETFKFALCFLPCLVPFIFNYIYVKQGNLTSGGATLIDYPERFFSYLFDTNLGYFAYFPILLLLFIGLFIVCMLRKQFRAVSYGIAFFGTVAAFSLMMHINCGMELSSRYVVWSFPIMAFFVTTVGLEVITRKVIGRVVVSVSVVVSLFILYYNTHPYYSYVEFNTITRQILNNYPQLYNPYSSLFNSRANHIDGGYNITTPVYYRDSENDYVRKILFLGTEEDKQKVMNEFKGNAESVAYLQKKLSKISNDGKYHYISIPRGSACELIPKNLEEKGELVTKGKIQELANVEISGQNQLGVVSLPIDIKSNTYYKLVVRLKNKPDIHKMDAFFVDFYAGSSYDLVAQEEKLSHESDEYSIIFNSGDISKVSEQINARIVAVSEEVVVIESFEVYEMMEKSADRELGEISIVNYVDTVNISGENGLDVLSFPVNIIPHSFYKIEVNIKGYQENPHGCFYVDFYGGAGYDNLQQEKPLQEGENTIYIYSGDSTTTVEQIYVRIVANTKNPVEISNLKVNEIKDESNIQ